MFDLVEEENHLLQISFVESVLQELTTYYLVNKFMIVFSVKIMLFASELTKSRQSKGTGDQILTVSHFLGV